MNYYIIIIILLLLLLILRITRKKHVSTVKKIINTPIIIQKKRFIKSKLFKKPLVLIPIISIRDNFYERQIGQEILSKTDKYNVCLIPIQILKQFLNLMTPCQFKKIKKIIINEKSPYFKSTYDYLLNQPNQYSKKLLILDTEKPICANILLSNLNISPCELRKNSVLNKQKIQLITDLDESKNNQGEFTIKILDN